MYMWPHVTQTASLCIYKPFIDSPGSRLTKKSKNQVNVYIYRMRERKKEIRKRSGKRNEKFTNLWRISNVGDEGADGATRLKIDATYLEIYIHI